MYIEIYRDAQGEDGRVSIGLVSPPRHLMAPDGSDKEEYWYEILDSERTEWLSSHQYTPEGYEGVLEDNTFIDWLVSKGWSVHEGASFEYNIA
jgi:hypothetical protein